MDKYPKMIYVSVLLLDNRIENWKISDRKWKDPMAISGYWKLDRLKDYKVQSIGFLCNNLEESEKVFNSLGMKWLKQWKHAKDYWMHRAY
jgi:hypothetical protein